MTSTGLFYAVAFLMVFCSAMVITRRQPVASAVYLIITMFLAAATFAMLGADFVAAIQVLVYAGAIMVLFLFVIMLLNVHPDELKGPPISAVEIFVMVLTVVAFLYVCTRLLSGESPGLVSTTPVADSVAALGNTHLVGRKLFLSYLWPFELSSFLILLSIISAIVIAKKPTQPKSEKAGA